MIPSQNSPGFPDFYLLLCVCVCARARALWQTRFALVVVAVAVVVIHISDLSATIVNYCDNNNSGNDDDGGGNSICLFSQIDRFNTNPQFHATEFYIFASLQF